MHDEPGTAPGPHDYDTPKAAEARRLAEEQAVRARRQRTESASAQEAPATPPVAAGPRPLVTADDAAALLVDYAPFWSPDEILAHPELARMAFVEAERIIAEERSALGKADRKTKARAAEIDDKVDALWQAAELLAAAQAD